jgi:uncharacterized protein involved in tolerance to divalent cations
MSYDDKSALNKIIFAFFSIDEIKSADSEQCGDWEPYKDDKCFKIIDKVTSQDDAEKACTLLGNSSTLITIHSEEQQEFLSNLLFKTHKTVENVWIGAKYTSNKIKWNDNSDASFTNWAAGSPRNENGYECIQMMADASSVGKWINAPCQKNNLIVCQKMQTWSLAQVQIRLLDLIENPVPVGFIYVQLPSQPEPKTLWSKVEWKDVTSDYAGLFFRAEGGGSEAFGHVQVENSPRLVAVDTENANEVVTACRTNCSVLANGLFSQYIWTGKEGTGNHLAMKLKVSSGEVRPRNQAVRVWKRVN